MQIFFLEIWTLFFLCEFISHDVPSQWFPTWAVKDRRPQAVQKYKENGHVLYFIDIMEFVIFKILLVALPDLDQGNKTPGRIVISNLNKRSNYLFIQSVNIALKRGTALDSLMVNKGALV